MRKYDSIKTMQNTMMLTMHFNFVRIWNLSENVSITNQLIFTVISQNKEMTAEWKYKELNYL